MVGLERWLNNVITKLDLLETLRQDCDLDYVIPLVVHGDDAEVHRRRSFMVTTFGSGLTAGAVWDTKFLCYCTDNSRVTHEGITTLDTWLSWSLLELSLGHFLDHDPFGREHPPHNRGRCGKIVGPYTAVLVIHKGDEKYIQKVYQMTSGATSKFVCFTCRAEKTGRNVYTTYGPQAPHRRTLLDTPTFIETGCGTQGWTRLPGWHISCLANDWLHVCDLAITPESAASVS